MTKEQSRVQRGIPTGGRYAASVHDEPDTNILAPKNTFHAVNSLEELDEHYDAMTSPENISHDGERSPAATRRAHKQLSHDYSHRKSELSLQALNADREKGMRQLAEKVRRSTPAYLENYAREQEQAMLDAQLQVSYTHMRQIATDVQSSHPEAEQLVLEAHNDDGDDYMLVSDVLDDKGQSIGTEDVMETAQDAVAEYGSRYLRRFSEAPVNLTQASRWDPGTQP